VNDLSSYIDAQRAAGAFESAGSFTLALEKAAQKLSSHSLVNAEDYILKLVQCAVRLEVNELHVKLLKRSVLLFFETDAADRTVSVDALSLALAAPLEESNPARAYLAMAICAVAGQSPTELMWGEWDSDSQGTILSLAAGRSEVFQNAPFPRLEPLAPGRRFFLFFMTKPSIGLPIGQTASEHTAITRRCAFTPMPLFLDGTPVGPSLPITFSAADPVSELTSAYLGALEITPGQPGSSLRWPAAPASKRTWANIPDGLNDFSPGLPPVFRLRLPKGFQNPMTSHAWFSEIYAVPIHLYGCSNLYYVKDGVVLHPVKAHDAGGGALAVLDGQHVKTDLTGLQVIQDETVLFDVARITESWKAQIDLMLSTAAPVYENQPIYFRSSTLVTAMGCCLLGPFGLLAGPISVFFNKRQGKVAQNQRKLARQLETRRGYLTFHRKEK
jgi:hypothetical protein